MNLLPDTSLFVSPFPQCTSFQVAASSVPSSFHRLSRGFTTSPVSWFNKLIHYTPKCSQNLISCKFSGHLKNQGSMCVTNTSINSLNPYEQFEVIWYKYDFKVPFVVFGVCELGSAGPIMLKTFLVWRQTLYSYVRNFYVFPFNVALRAYWQRSKYLGQTDRWILENIEHTNRVMCLSSVPSLSILTCFFASYEQFLIKKSSY